MSYEHALALFAAMPTHDVRCAFTQAVSDEALTIATEMLLLEMEGAA